MKKWKCSVCGYVHTGDEPPEKCPVCGADKSKFVEYVPEDTTEKKEESKPEPKTETGAPVWKQTGKQNISHVYTVATDLMVKNHLHPISVHIPNGVLPVAVVFAILAMVFQSVYLDKAAFYNLIFVLLSMPVVLFAGYLDWKKKFDGNMTPLFFTKMICGATVFFLSLVLVLWRIVDPDVAMSDSSARIPFLLFHVLLLVAAAIAGHLGGKLVFNNK